jgi:tyrosinase
VAQQGSLRVRKNIKTLNAQEIASLERGVSVMKQRPKESPLSWAFQANMHGFVASQEPVVYYGWGGCQHGNWWFLPWHRAYLYFFERILREASGDPSLNLPYWDWTKPDQLELPEPFLNPNSPLYDASRASDAIDESAVRWQDALAEVIFASPDPQQGFGGQAESLPGPYRPHGGLESLAHDNVHDEVGGNMGDPETAARDPIFWLHHANIDRLWGQWLRLQEGRYNPDDPTWLNTQFYFYTITGQLVQIALSQFLDSTSSQMLLFPYRYDIDPAVTAGALAQAAPAFSPRARMAAPPPGQRKSEVLAAQTPTRTELGSEPLSVSLSLGPEPRKRMEQAAAAAQASRTAAPGAAPPAAAGPSIHIAIDDIQFEGPPGRFYEIYLNLPDPSLATGSKSPYFAGTLSFFGLHGGHGAAHQMQPQTGATEIIDVTKAVARLKALGKLEGDLKVTLIQKGGRRKPRAAGPAARVAAAPPKVTIGAIRLMKVGE